MYIHIFFLVSILFTFLFLFSNGIKFTSISIHCEYEWKRIILHVYMDTFIARNNKFFKQMWMQHKILSRLVGLKVRHAMWKFATNWNDLSCRIYYQTHHQLFGYWTYSHQFGCCKVYQRCNLNDCFALHLCVTACVCPVCAYVSMWLCRWYFTSR